MNSVRAKNRKKFLAKPKPICKCGKTLRTSKSKTCLNCAPHPHKIDWPTHEVLTKMVAASNFEQVGRTLGVSGNAIRKHLGLKK